MSVEKLSGVRFDFKMRKQRKENKRKSEKANLSR